MSKTSNIFLVLFICTLFLSGVLFIINNSLASNLKDCKQEKAYLIEDREFLFSLIPEIKPQASKENIAQIINIKYPNERIDMLDNLVSWRFFKFWFDKKGKLELVQYSS